MIQPLVLEGTLDLLGSCFFSIHKLYFFFKFENSKNIFKIWTVIFVIFIFDIYVERITGSNLFGFGKIQIDGVLQPHGQRIVSFFKTEPIAGAFVTGYIFIVSGYLIDSFKKKESLESLYHFCYC